MTQESQALPVTQHLAKSRMFSWTRIIAGLCIVLCWALGTFPAVLPPVQRSPEVAAVSLPRSAGRQLHSLQQPQESAPQRGQRPRREPLVQEPPFPQDSRRPRYGRGPAPDGNIDRDEYPQWQIDQSFQHDVFTFVRVQFDSYGRGGSFGGWSNDYPDCDLNFSYRLQELTSLQVDPNGKVLRLTDPALFDYPFLFMSNLQQIALSEPEILALRRYLLNGGFLLADDFWTPTAWRHISGVMREVLPGREPVELDYSHPIFHLIYDLPAIPRIPSIRAWQQGHTFEYWHGDPEGDEDPHFMGYFDDAGRLIAVFCYNNDVGDGFEREGENHEYFEKYSVQVSYPLGINIVMYALTH